MSAGIPAVILVLANFGHLVFLLAVSSFMWCGGYWRHLSRCFSALSNPNMIAVTTTPV
jgi:hypothetical protein